MPVCPLCESSQPVGDACDVCGRPFAVAERNAPPAPPVPDLETTHHAPVAADGERFPELEPTAAAPVGAPIAELTEGLEPTLYASAGEVVAEPMEPVDLEPTAAAPIPGDPEPRGPVTCRYCGTPATGWERLCARCGIRLPLPRARARAAGAWAPMCLCTDCGVPVTGDRCRGCGARQTGG